MCVLAHGESMKAKRASFLRGYLHFLGTFFWHYIFCSVVDDDKERHLNLKHDEKKKGKKDLDVGCEDERLIFCKFGWVAYDFEMVLRSKLMLHRRGRS